MSEQPAAAAGQPRLVVVPIDGHAAADRPEARGEETTFELRAGRTLIGADTDRDIVLDGLAGEHAVIDWWTGGDEFIFTRLAAPGSATSMATSHPPACITATASSSARRRWCFQRDEDADHVRRGRARQGGESAGSVGAKSRGHETETTVVRKTIDDDRRI